MERRDVLALFGALAVAPYLGPLSPEKRLALGGSLDARLAAGAAGRALDRRQMALVTALSDTIIPRTDTPGALDVRVPAFVDLLMAEWYPDKDRAEIEAWLTAFDARCREATGKFFAELDAERRTGLLGGEEANASGGPGGAGGGYRRIKDAIVFGYLTSEPVAEMVRTMPIIPGRFDGCVPVGGSL